MNNAIKLDKNKLIIDLVLLKDLAFDDVMKHIKLTAYKNNIDVLYVISDVFDNEKDEFNYLKKIVKALKKDFNTFLMLKTGYFSSTNFFDSVFALGVDALSLKIENHEEAKKDFKTMIDYITTLWPSGAVFTDVVAINCSDEDIKDKISFYSKLKVIPRILKENDCSSGEPDLCIRDFIFKNLKKNGVSVKWVMNFELCGLIQQDSGTKKGKSKRKIAGKVAFELASLRRRLMVKEVQNSFDSASL